MQPSPMRSSKRMGILTISPEITGRHLAESNEQEQTRQEKLKQDFISFLHPPIPGSSG